jgi:hypothetical protein
VVRRSPCETYFKYLISHPDAYSDDDIRKLVKMQQLDYIGRPYLQRLRLTCGPPSPFFPEDKLHLRSQRYIRKERMEGLYHPDDDTYAAAEILENPRAKELVESMLLTDTQFGWVAAVLHKRLGMNIQPSALRRYKLYYFNVDLVDSTEMKALLEARAISDASQDVDEQVLGVSVIKANKSDPRSLSAGMSSSPLAGMLNVIRAGYLPSNVEVGKLANAARNVAIIGTLESSMRGLAAQGRDYALIAKMMTEILEQAGDAQHTLDRELHRLMLETDTGTMPHVNELTDGSHTIDLQPLPTGESDNAKR